MFFARIFEPNIEFHFSKIPTFFTFDDVKLDWCIKYNRRRGSFSNVFLKKKHTIRKLDDFIPKFPSVGKTSKQINLIKLEKDFHSIQQISS